jgi:chemotaxis signal transduction protein
VVTVPARVPGLVGVAGASTSLVAVFDVASLLRGTPPVERRWLVVARADRQVGFVVDAVDAFLRLAERHVLPSRADQASSLTPMVLDDGRALRPILDIGAALRAVRESLGSAGRGR